MKGSTVAALMVAAAAMIAPGASPAVAGHGSHVVVGAGIVGERTLTVYVSEAEGTGTAVVDGTVYMMDCVAFYSSGGGSDHTHRVWLSGDGIYVKLAISPTMPLPNYFPFALAAIHTQPSPDPEECDASFLDMDDVTGRFIVRSEV